MIEARISTIYLLRLPTLELQAHWSKVELSLNAQGQITTLCSYDDLMPHGEAIDWANTWIYSALKKFDPPRFYRKPGERTVFVEDSPEFNEFRQSIQVMAEQNQSNYSDMATDRISSLELTPAEHVMLNLKSPATKAFLDDILAVCRQHNKSFVADMSGGRPWIREFDENDDEVIFSAVDTTRDDYRP